MKRSFFLRALPFVFILGGFALRLYRLGANSLWYDETVSLLLARAEIPELIRHTAGDIHPPLYYLLLHAWGRAAGWSEFAAAFLSLWFGVLLVALAYRVGREWFAAPAPLPSTRHSRRLALIAAFLVAISPYNLWYSQEVRMYTLGAALGLLSVYFLRRMLRQPNLWTRDFAAYVLVTVLGFYTLYYFVFLMVFEWLWAASLEIRNSKFEIRNSNSGIFLAAQLAIVLLYLPWLPTALRQALDPPVPPWRAFVALTQVAAESVSALAFGQAVDPWRFAPLALLLWMPIAAALLLRDPFRVSTAVSPWLLVGYTLIPLGAIYLLSFWKPLYHVRYLFTYSPAFYLLAAYGLYVTGRGIVRWNRTRGDALPKLAGALALLGAAAFVGMTGYTLANFWHNEQYAEDDLRGAVRYIAERWRPGDAILVNAGYAYPALEYYFPGTIARERLTAVSSNSSEAPEIPLVLQTGSIGGAPNLGWGDPQSDFYATTAAETQAALERVLADHPRVWLLRIYDTVVDPDGVIRRYFDEHATLLDDQAFTGESQVRVQGYLSQKPGRDLPSSATRTSKSLDDRVELVGYELDTSGVERGDSLDVVLYWKLLQPVNYNYQVTLQLLDANGSNVAQTDELPLSALLPMTRWTVGSVYREPLRLRIPAELSPGAYRAIVKLYNPRTLEVLGDRIDLATIPVQ